MADDAEAVLSESGLNPTTAINIFYRRTVINSALPLNTSLDEGERANLRSLKATERTSAIKPKGAREAADWLNDPDED